NFRGRCIVVTGSERNLGQRGWGNTISSMRRVRSAAGIIPPPGTETPAGWNVILFDQLNFRGLPVKHTAPVGDLGAGRPMTRSVTVGRGVWELCSGVNFSGRCLTVDRNMPSLGSSVGFRVRSLRPLVRQTR